MPKLTKSFTLGELKEILILKFPEFDNSEIFNGDILLFQDQYGVGDPIDDDTYLISLFKED